MASFTLEIDEFAALVGFLNAKKIVGMDEQLFASFTETNLPDTMAKLQAHGFMTPADRPDTWHTNEDLIQMLSVAVAPHVAILGRSKAEPKSILFYAADNQYVQIVVTNTHVIVRNIVDEDMLAVCLVSFMNAAFPAEVVVARVHDETFDAGRVAVVDEQGTMHTSIRGPESESESPWNEASIATFVRDAIGELLRT